MTVVVHRVTKQAARYTPAGGVEKCALCRFFAPQGWCGKVVGPVSPRGWCKYYSREAVQRWSNPGYAGAGGPATAPSLDLGFLTPGVLDPRLVFTRASSGTYFDSGGVMRTAGLNLWMQSADANNAAWGKGLLGVAAPITTANQTVAPDGTLTAASVVFPAVSSAGTVSQLFQQLAVTAAVYTFSVWMKGAVGGEQLYLFNQTGGTNYNRQRCTLTNAWQRFVLVTQTLTAASWQFNIGNDLRDGGQTSTPGGTVFVWGAQVELGPVATQYAPTTTVANSSPRWDYDPVSLQLRGMLLEDQRTNAAISSSDYTGATYNKSGVTVALNGPASPDGVSLMTTVTEGVTASNHSFYSANNLSVTAATWTYSVFVRPGTQRYISLRGNAADAVPNLPWITFDTQARTINANASVASSGFLALPGGTFRIWMTAPSTATATGAMVVAGSNIATAPVQSSSLGNSYTGTSQTWYAWGLQAELGDFPTSFIPTTTVAVTRSIDSCLIPPANMSPWFAPPGGSWFAEFDYISTSAAPAGRIITQGALANTAAMHMPGSPAFTVGQFDGAAAMNAVTTISPNTSSRAATTWAVGQAKVCTSGGAVASSASLTTGYAGYVANGVRFMTAVNPALSLYGHIRRVQYYPRVLADAEMQSLTTITDPSLFLNFMNPNTLDPRIAFTRASTATYTDVNGVVQTANNDTPRWDYDPVTHALRGLLLEEARTNLIPISIDFTAWTGQSTGGPPFPVVTADQVVAPDGTMTADRIDQPVVNIPTTSVSQLARGITATAAVYTYSVWLRGAVGGEQTYLFHRSGSYPAVPLRVTLTTQWQRFVIVTGTLVAGAWNFYIGTDLRDTQQSATPAQTIYAWGAQVELGAFPTSFILTTGSTVTRAADAMNMPVSSWFNSSGSTLSAEFFIPPETFPNLSSSVREACGLCDGTIANRLTLRALSANGASNGLFFSTVSSVNSVSAANPALTAGVAAKQIAAWNGTVGHGTVNGGTIISVNAGMPSGISLLVFGNNAPGQGGALGGALRAVRYWPRVLSDAEMQQVTT